MIKDLKCTFKYFNVTSLQSALFKRLYIMYYQQAQFKKKKKQRTNINATCTSQLFFELAKSVMQLTED